MTDCRSINLQLKDFVFSLFQANKSSEEMFCIRHKPPPGGSGELATKELLSAHGAGKRRDRITVQTAHHPDMSRQSDTVRLQRL
jgi:hypothetical protein